MFQDLVLCLYFFGVVQYRASSRSYCARFQWASMLTVLCSVLFLVLFWASLALLWSNRIGRDVCFFPVSFDDYEETTVNLFILNVWYNLPEMPYNHGFLFIEYFYYLFNLFSSLCIYTYFLLTPGHIYRDHIYI